MLHFILTAPDCLPSALEMQWLSLQPTQGSVREDERSQVANGQEKHQGLLSSQPASMGTQVSFFCWHSKFQETAVHCNTLPGSGFDKHQQEQGHWCTLRKAKPENCFS